TLTFFHLQSKIKLRFKSSSTLEWLNDTTAGPSKIPITELTSGFAEATQQNHSSLSPN
ncbi:hypothetical protein ACJMK2_013272, partial [Sinanodonta woodiana]